MKDCFVLQFKLCFAGLALYEYRVLSDAVKLRPVIILLFLVLTAETQK